MIFSVLSKKYCRQYRRGQRPFGIRYIRKIKVRYAHVCGVRECFIPQGPMNVSAKAVRGPMYGAIPGIRFSGVRGGAVTMLSRRVCKPVNNALRLFGSEMRISGRDDPVGTEWVRSDIEKCL